MAIAPDNDGVRELAGEHANTADIATASASGQDGASEEQHTLQPAAPEQASLADAEPARVNEPPPPDSRPIPEAGGYLKIVLPLTAIRPIRRARSWPDPLSALREGVAKAGSRKVALIVASVLVALTLSGAGYLATDYYAPAVVANGFCSDLQARDFGSAYDRLSSELQGQISRERFQQASQALDDGEGRVTGCDVNLMPGGYGRSPGAPRATIQASIHRERAGRLSGRVAVAREDSAWRITGIDATTLGADLPALGMAGAYCEALRAGDYLGAYTTLSHELQDTLAYSQFVELAQAAEQIDGAIQTCGLAGTGAGKTDSATALLAIVRRGFTGEHRGTILLSAQSGHWEIIAVGPTAMGSDLDPLRIGVRFCADLVSGALDDAYTLVSERYRAQITQIQFTDDLRPDAGARWTGCAPDLSAYLVETDQASYDVTLSATFSDGATTSVRLRLLFTNVQSRWRVDSVQF
jgi:hypothetical protein